MNTYYSDFQKLSLKERQIATLMSEGYQANELGQRLHINPSLLVKLKRKMMNKLSVDSMKDFGLFLNWVRKYID